MLAPEVHSLAKQLALDLRRDWGTGTKRTVEEVILNYPQLQSDADAVVELVYSEFVARTAAGETPDPTEFSHRFPAHAEPIARQLAVDALFEDLPLDTIAYQGNTTSQPSQPQPDKIGRYLVVGSLGVGGQGDVYRAIHPDLSLEVVIKLGHHGTTLGRETLRSEARLLATLDHPGIARVFDLDTTTDGQSFFVIEYVRGPNLRQYAHTRPVTSATAVTLVAKVARAVEYAHRHGVVHLDIKPANIVLDPHKKPRLIDFGLSRLRSGFVDETAPNGSVSGTAAFMAPEQARGEPTGPATDIFGLGGVLYFLLTGQAPFEAKRIIDSLELAKAGRWDHTKLATVPPRIAAICCKALSPTVAERYASAADMADDLERVAHPRRRWFVPLIVVVFALLAVVVAIAWPSSTLPVVVQPVAAPVGKLTVSAWVGDRYIPLPEPAPLRSRQLVRMEAEVPRDFHAALISCDAIGKLSLLANHSLQQHPTTFRYPADSQKGVPLTGPPGTEVVLFVARHEPIALEDVQAAWGTSQPWPELPHLSVLRLSGPVVTVLQQDRGFGQPQPQRDPETAVKDNLAALGKKLGEQFPVVEAVAFRHSK